MASINFNPFGDNWFKFPPKLPIPPIHFVASLFKPQAKVPNFAAISNPFAKKPKPDPDDKPGKYTRMLEQFYWECENDPDYRNSPVVEDILREDPLFEKKENPTPEEIEENEKWWNEFRSSPVVQFIARAEEIADEFNKMELKDNSVPYKKEDKKLWQAWEANAEESYKNKAGVG